MTRARFRTGQRSRGTVRTSLARIAAAMWDAFISHASQDMAAAIRLGNRSLSAEGLSAWVDHPTISAPAAC